MNALRTLGTAAALAGALSVTTDADAADANGLGERGQLILSADRLFHPLSHDRESTTVTNGPTTTTDAVTETSSALLIGAGSGVATVHTVPRVAFDFTVVSRLTLGGSLAVAFGLSASRETETKTGADVRERTREQPKQTLFGVSPRIGYILPLGDVVAFWPRGGVSFYSARTKFEEVRGDGTVVTVTDSDTVFSFDVDPQLVIAPTRHVFFHLGPLLNVPLSGARRREEAVGGQTDSASTDLSVFHVGISAGLGGWFDL